MISNKRKPKYVVCVIENTMATLLLASVGSNGAWPLHAKNAANIPCKISKKRIPHPIMCSGNGVAPGTNVVEKATTVPVGKEPEVIPARPVLGRSGFPPGFVFGTASSAYQVFSLIQLQSCSVQ